MEDKKFIKSFLILSLLLLSTVGVLNFIVDPGNLYLKRILLERNSQNIYKTFSDSEDGVVWSGDERIFSYILLSNVNKVDCVVVGSSRAMQVSLVRGVYIKEHCDSLLNVSVSGGVLEDYLIFTRVLMERKSDVKKVFLEIPPWLFKHDMDKRYQLFLDKLTEARAEPQNSTWQAIKYNLDLLKNLFNLEFSQKTWETIREKKSLFESPLKSVRPLNKNDVVGVDEATKLKDGSHLYSLNYRKNAQTGTAYDKRPLYKLKGPAYDSKAILEFQKMVLELKEHTEVVFIQSPYHRNSLANKYTTEVNLINAVDKILKNMAGKLNVDLIGSYHPSAIDCDEDEFFDFMHPRPSCMDKVFK